MLSRTLVFAGSKAFRVGLTFPNIRLPQRDAQISVTLGPSMTPLYLGHNISELAKTRGRNIIEIVLVKFASTSVVLFVGKTVHTWTRYVNSVGLFSFSMLSNQDLLGSDIHKSETFPIMFQPDLL